MKTKKLFRSQKLNDFITAFSLLLVTTALCFFLFFCISQNAANIALLYLLGIISVSYCTTGYAYGILASFVGVILINCFFTYPYFQVNFIISDYPFTFLFMLIASVITSTATSHLKNQAKTLALNEKQLAEADKEKIRANLLRAVSHDLRTPLTSIMGALSTLEENDAAYTPSERKEVIHNIYDDANWLLNMVENLLSITRIESGTSRLKTSPEMIEEVVAEAISRLKKRFPWAEIDVSIPDEILMIPMDAMLIEQVLMNLLENSLVHSKSQRPPKLLVENLPDTICFRVIDYGVGIPVTQLDTIFDGKFSSSPSDVRKGMGIGLSICKTIIASHKGTITARNHDSGAEFLFTLPKEERHV